VSTLEAFTLSPVLGCIPCDPAAAHPLCHTQLIHHRIGPNKKGVIQSTSTQKTIKTFGNSFDPIPADEVRDHFATGKPHMNVGLKVISTL
jgi:hypothetical protein